MKGKEGKEQDNKEGEMGVEPKTRHATIRILFSMQQTLNSKLGSYVQRNMLVSLKNNDEAAFWGMI